MPEPLEIRGTDGKTSIEETVPKPRVLQDTNKKATRKTGRLMVPTGLQPKFATVVLEKTCGESTIHESGAGPISGPILGDPASGGQYRAEAIEHLEAAWKALKLWRLTATTEAELKTAERLGGSLAILMQSADWGPDLK